jgi:hypothetical protein
LLRILLATAALALSACVGSQAIRPVAATDVSLVCIKVNPDNPSPDFVAELRNQLSARGLRSLAYDVKAPSECRYRMLYWASWEWDLTKYLTFADLKVYDGDTLVGQASYDAWARGLGLQKYHPTSEKIGVLLDHLFPSKKPH